MAFIFFKKERMASAIRKGDLPRVRQFLDRGANPNMKDDFNYSMLAIAVDAGNLDIASLLVERGAVMQPRVPGWHGGNLLHLAVKNGHLPLVKYLLHKDIGLLNAGDDRGFTPLHIAADMGHLDIARHLLEAGADTDIRDKFNRTAYYRAQDARRDDIMSLMRPYQREYRTSPVHDGWQKLAEEKIAHVRHERAIGYRITEIFNFAVHERTVICQNMDTRAEAVETKSFADIDDKTRINEALIELKKRGGRGTSGQIDKRR